MIPTVFEIFLETKLIWDFQETVLINDNTYPRYLLEIAIEQIHLTVIAFVYLNKVKNKQFFN